MALAGHNERGGELPFKQTGQLREAASPDFSVATSSLVRVQAPLALHLDVESLLDQTSLVIIGGGELVPEEDGGSCPSHQVSLVLLFSVQRSMGIADLDEGLFSSSYPLDIFRGSEQVDDGHSIKW